MRLALQVLGCEADLQEENKVYCLQRRICSHHMQVRPDGFVA